MIQEYIKDLVKEQKEYYNCRWEILEGSLTYKEREELESTGKMSNRVFKKLRDYVMDFEWDDNNASYDEWYIRGTELLGKDIIIFIKTYIDKIESQWNVSKDYMLWMKDLLKEIK